MSRATATARTPEDARQLVRLLERRTQVMKALAHPSRLRMVEVLSAGEQCVCDLQALVGADLSTVSKHLSLLKAAGIVLSEKRGQQVFYRLRVPCLLSFFSCVDAVFADPDAELVEVPPPSTAAAGKDCAGGCTPAPGTSGRRRSASAAR
jgi:DNA-binding transcriptional ArsR family regulator